MSAAPLSMSRERAVAFFAAFFGGEHRIPGKVRGEENVKPFGLGWMVIDTAHDAYATFDFDELTRLVFMAHEEAVRVEVSPQGRHLRVCIWERTRSAGALHHRSRFHPTLQAALTWWRAGLPDDSATVEDRFRRMILHPTFRPDGVNPERLDLYPEPVKRMWLEFAENLVSHRGRTLDEILAEGGTDAQE